MLIRRLRLARDRSGATAIEYALIAGIIATVVVATVPVIGTNVAGKIDEAAEGLSP